MSDIWANLRIRCYTCNGTGEYRGQDSSSSSCPECNGDKYVDSRMQVDFGNIVDKLDAIITEQASQRVDLTAALTQIWNRVKDL